MPEFGVLGDESGLTEELDTNKVLPPESLNLLIDVRIPNEAVSLDFRVCGRAFDRVHWRASGTTGDVHSE